MKPTNTRRPDRRQFLKTSALAAAVAPFGATVVANPARAARTRRDGKLRIAGIGAGGKGTSDIWAMRSEEIVALCDVDTSRAAKSIERFPNARFYADYRDLFDRETDLDAVVVSTPDHSHATPAMMAIERGMHVYCQKPLTHSVEEARLLAVAAREKGVVTQMGNQGTATDGLREATEVLRSGAIGKVRTVHVWTNRPIWAQGVDRPEGVDPIPEHLRWDLFLGPAPYRPYKGGYHPFSWRGWWDYGTGALGDMACHIMNLAYKALNLGAPTKVEPVAVDGLRDESAPNRAIVRYEFPARGDDPAVELFWYDGNLKPPAELLPEGREWAGGGSILVGDEGMMYSDDDYGARYELWPEEKFKGYQPPKPWIPRAPRVGEVSQHELIHQEFLAACKGEGETSSSFDGYAGPFTEAVLLGNVAQRLGRTLEWDAVTMTAKGVPTADALIRKEYARGFEPPMRDLLKSRWH